MAFSKIILNGVTQIDLTNDTVASSNLLTGETATGADGESVVGAYTPSGGGLTYESGTFVPSGDIVNPAISFANAHSEAPIAVIMTDAMGLNVVGANVVFCFIDYWKAFGAAVMRNGTPYYASAYRSYINPAGSSVSSAGTNFTHSSDETEDITNQYPRYYATEVGFCPDTGSSTRPWRSGRTYKWLAVWRET